MNLVTRHSSFNGEKNNFKGKNENKDLIELGHLYIKWIHHYTSSCIKHKCSYPYPSEHGWNSPSSSEYTYCINTLCDASGLAPNLSSLCDSQNVVFFRACLFLNDRAQVRRVAGKCLFLSQLWRGEGCTFRNKIVMLMLAASNGLY